MTGEPDGVIGPATLEAVKTYQRSKGLGVDGFPSLTLLKLLQRETPPANVPQETSTTPEVLTTPEASSSPEKVN
jgi:membrane-bound lytic murein transglycosylase B